MNTHTDLAKLGIFISAVFFLTNDMTKFLVGFVSGIYVSTKYDFKPYITLVEEKVIQLKKEFETKRDESVESGQAESGQAESGQKGWTFWPKTPKT